MRSLGGTLRSGARRRFEALSRLARDERGAVMVEYTAVVGLMAIGAAIALVAVGGALVRSFAFHRSFLLLPVP